MRGRGLLYLPCHLHTYEIILRSVFEEKLFKSSDSDILLFKKFRKPWPNINKLNLKSSCRDNYVHEKLQNIREKLDFCLYNIDQKQPRESYKEFLVLTVVFLGDPFHYIRWMVTAIYLLKIYLFRQKFYCIY